MSDTLIITGKGMNKNKGSTEEKKKKFLAELKKHKKVGKINKSIGLLNVDQPSSSSRKSDSKYKNLVEQEMALYYKNPADRNSLNPKLSAGLVDPNIDIQPVKDLIYGSYSELVLTGVDTGIKNMWGFEGKGPRILEIPGQLDAVYNADDPYKEVAQQAGGLVLGSLGADVGLATAAFIGPWAVIPAAILSYGGTKAGREITGEIYDSVKGLGKKWSQYSENMQTEYKKKKPMSSNEYNHQKPLDTEYYNTPLHANEWSPIQKLLGDYKAKRVKQAEKLNMNSYYESIHKTGSKPKHYSKLNQTNGDSSIQLLWDRITGGGNEEPAPSVNESADDLIVGYLKHKGMMPKKGIKNNENKLGLNLINPYKIKYKAGNEQKNNNSRLLHKSTIGKNTSKKTNKNMLNTIGRYLGFGLALGLRRFANGGMVNKTTVGMIGEDGPEAIIPLSSKRRQRGVQLWNEAGTLLGAHNNMKNNRAGKQNNSGSSNVKVGSVTISVKGKGKNTSGNMNLLTLLQEQKGQVSDELCSILADALEGAYKNIPVAQ